MVPPAACPRCGWPDDVEPLRQGFYCNDCCFVFQGSDAEWETYSAKRREIQQSKALAASGLPVGNV